jgi:SAM-dependent methyltransferase
MSTVDLRALVMRIATRTPGRSEATLQADIRTLLLAAPLSLAEHGVVDINLETPAGERRRIDIEAGFAVIEVKRDLRLGNIRHDAIAQLAGYVSRRISILGQRYVGILTDGTEWSLYHLAPSGVLEQVGSPLLVDAVDPNLDQLFTWLEDVLATGQQILPTPHEIERRLGSDSQSHALDYADLSALFEVNRDRPSVALKRELWAKLLTTALGTSFRNEDSLFVEHTLLVAMAEVISHAVVGYAPTQFSPATLLSGALFEEAQVGGVIEEDFFDWVIEVEGGEEFIRALARRLARFDWSAVHHDVMKVLYESVIGRSERYNLGEYYTPDWLSERVINDVVREPLKERVLDPGCGSGTFLFFAVRRYLAAAEAKGIDNATAIRGVTEHVLGIDLHPVAVTLARVTYLLAIGMNRISGPREAFNVPVYLGDSLQWSQEQGLQKRTLMSANMLTIPTGTGDQRFASELLFPDTLLADAGRFDRLVTELADRASQRPSDTVPSLLETFRRYPMSEADQATITETFHVMCQLHDSGRDHIWAYYVRNLARPTLLSEEGNRVNIVLGNPPWLTYNAIATDLKPAFRQACQERNLWGGRTVRNYDLSALFVVRSIELYLKLGGRFAFVMPRAVLTRAQFEGFRGAKYIQQREQGRRRSRHRNLTNAEPVVVSFDTPWDLDQVRPHPFPVPCAVVLGTRPSDGTVKRLPVETLEWSGSLPSRNIGWAAAQAHLTETAGQVRTVGGAFVSQYASRFESGAKLNPQVLVIVQEVPTGPLGIPAGYRSVRSIRSTQGNWREVRSLHGAIESEFVRSTHLGSTIFPFRVGEPKLAVVPWQKSTKVLLHAADDGLNRYPRLAEWWTQASALWNQYGTPELYDLTNRIDYQRKLSRQFPLPSHRIVYTSSGSRMTAARLDDDRALVTETLYWASTDNIMEARYLTAILNSQIVTDHVAPYQARGQFGTRHFHKHVWYLPIPLFDESKTQHVDLAQLGKRAEEAAANVMLPEGTGNAAARRRIRRALDSDGVAGEIERAVAELLPVSD